MTTRPRPVPLDRSLLPGLAAVALFAVLAVVILQAETAWLVEDPGFGEGSVVGSIGAALIGVPPAIPAESFVVALLVIAVALDAALDGSLMLAKREGEGERAGGDPVTDGGGSDSPVTDGGGDASDRAREESDADGGEP